MDKKISTRKPINDGMWAWKTNQLKKEANESSENRNYQMLDSGIQEVEEKNILMVKCLQKLNWKADKKN